MNCKKAGYLLLILLCLPAHLIAQEQNQNRTRLISCPGNRDNQRFVCLNDAVAIVKGHLGEKIQVVGYKLSNSKRLAEEFKQQLISALKEARLDVDESLFEAIDGGSRDEPWIEIVSQ